MAVGRCLYAGGSFGRVQVIINWTLDNWQEFDAWCCVRGVDPLELPSYRYYNLALFALTNEKPEDSIKHYEEILTQADQIQHPIKAIRKVIAVNYFATAPKTKTRRTTTPNKKQTYVPSWWRGDEVNAKIAMGMMTQLPG